MGRYPSYNCRQLERRLREIGCELLRTAGSHRHYSNPFRPDRLITFA
jgi:predicted RNA binding protein YcfA (HicA-like mRNA interferase family)